VRIVVILVAFLIGMVLVSITTISPEMKIFANIAMFLVAIWRITIYVDALVKKYPILAIKNNKD